MSAERPTCKSCIYWDNSGESGYCRVEAPAIHSDREHYREGAWPYTQSTDWCGKHQDFIKWMLDRSYQSKQEKIVT